MELFSPSLHWRVPSFVSDSFNMLNNPLHPGHEAITLAINFEALTQLYPCTAAASADELKISPGWMMYKKILQPTTTKIQVEIIHPLCKLCIEMQMISEDMQELSQSSSSLSSYCCWKIKALETLRGEGVENFQVDAIWWDFSSPSMLTVFMQHLKQKNA